MMLNVHIKTDSTYRHMIDLCNRALKICNCKILFLNVKQNRSELALTLGPNYKSGK